MTNYEKGEHNILYKYMYAPSQLLTGFMHYSLPVISVLHQCDVTILLISKYQDECDIVHYQLNNHEYIDHLN